VNTAHAAIANLRVNTMGMPSFRRGGAAAAEAVAITMRDRATAQRRMCVSNTAHTNTTYLRYTHNLLASRVDEHKAAGTFTIISCYILLHFLQVDVGYFADIAAQRRFRRASVRRVRSKERTAPSLLKITLGHGGSS
jgi:hypothetical protein